jgi:hypothetical protein
MDFGCILYHRMNGRMTPEMRAFDSWMHIMHPDKFEVQIDADLEFEQAYRAAVATLKGSGRRASLMLGPALIRYFKENLNAPGFGAPIARN